MWTSQVYGHHDKMARTKTHRTSQNTEYTSIVIFYDSTYTVYSVKRFEKMCNQGKGMCNYELQLRIVFNRFGNS